MKFGFLAHTTNRGQRNQVRAMGLLRSVTAAAGEDTRVPHVRLPLLSTVTSRTGATCTGEVHYLPFGAEEMIRHARVTRDVVLEEALRLRDNGADVIGLGGATAIVGDRGSWVQERAGVAMTSGNSLTVYAAYSTVLRVLDLLDHSGHGRVAVIGYPGSIGLALARLLIDSGCTVDLVHRRGTSRTDRLLDYLAPAERERVRLYSDVAACLRENSVVVAASSTGGLVETNMLRPGTVVVDVALPRDVTADVLDREDVLVLDGGLVSGTGITADGGALPAPTEQMNGCLAETVVLALAGRAESFSLGRVLEPAKVLEIGETAAEHGFRPAPLASFGRPVPEQRLLRLRQWHPAPTAERARAGAEQPEHRAASRFRRHINPHLADLFDTNGMGQVFTRAEGATLTTADGTEYLDFVAGFGALNVGHNHPEVVRRVRKFLDVAEPVFTQYVSLPPHAGELAERLCDLAPGNLERAFFANSGAEAVEAALKTARAATGRERIVFVDNSYHGKTMGALSVTGRASYRTPFGPLIPECVSVPFGDLEALRAAVDGAAAFIVEPVLGEGGVRLPPPGYLAAAQEVCREAGAVLVLDEVQTGLGRTGALFACEHDGVHPDILCVAKSLSGGLVPIGVTLSTAEVWDAAYGSSTRSLLHTSTFGGGNLACAAGLATLDVLVEEDLPARAAKLGDHVRQALRTVTAKYDFVSEVRGIGMMNAIAFDATYDGALGSLVDDALTRLPWNLGSTLAVLPDATREALREAAGRVEADLGDMLCLRFVAELARDHRILTFVTANSSQVLRIQPPLVLTEEQVQRFVDAVERVCARFALQAGIRAWRE